MIDLIVMRLADMHRLHPEQDNSHVCAKCGEQVGIYPSGQAMLRRYSTTRIVCQHCREDAGTMILAPGAEREAFESKPAPRKGPPS